MGLYRVWGLGSFERNIGRAYKGLYNSNNIN